MSGGDDRRSPFTFGADPDAGDRRRPSVPGWLKLVLVLAAAAGGGAAYLHFVDPQLGRELLRGTPVAPAPAVTIIYKWRDAAGSWQLTDRPPPEGTRYETVEARSDANIIPSLVPGKGRE